MIGSQANEPSSHAYNLCEEIVVFCCSEIVCCSYSCTAKRLTVSYELNVSECRCYAFVSVNIEGVELDAYLAVATRVDCFRIQKVSVCIYYLRLRLVVAVDEECVSVCLIVFFNVAVSERKLAGCLVWLLASELICSIFQGLVDGLLD